MSFNPRGNMDPVTQATVSEVRETIKEDWSDPEIVGFLESVLGELRQDLAEAKNRIIRRG